MRASRVSTLVGSGLIAVVGLTAARAGGTRAGGADGHPLDANVLVRDGLRQARAQFVKGRGHVAFLGGSITEMEGYRPRVEKRLRKRFPETDFQFTNAGIASTGSTTGAFRLRRDVLSEGPVDLLFVEFAVNDEQDAALSRTEAIRGMEGIVRQTRRHNPKAAIVFVYFVNPPMLETLRRGETPLPTASHEAVARRYGIPAIRVGREVAERIDAGELTWDAYGGTHPADRGNALCAAMVGRLFDRAWDGPSTDQKKQPLPDPVDAHHYGRGRLLAPARASPDDAWRRHVPKWSMLDGRCRSRFKDTEVLEATTPGATLTLGFEGTAVGAYVLAGPSAGVVEARVDGGAFRRVDLYHRFSEGLHYPRTVMFATELDRGRHTLELRVAKETSSGGHAVRIMHFVAN